MPTPKPKTGAVKIAKNSKAPNLSKGQKLFHQLREQINMLTGQLKAWDEMLPLFQRQYQDQFQPMLDEFNALRLQMLGRLDEAYRRPKGLTKTERKYLRGLIEELIETLIEFKPSPELKKLFGEYQGYSFEEYEEGMQQEFQAMMTEVSGMKFEEKVDIHDPQAVLGALHKTAQAHFEQVEAQGEGQGEGPAPKLSKREQKQQQQREQAEQQMGQTLREVYRKLAAALHPDREPDEAERARKTELMSRVNVAYDNKDLLRLLELQWEVEQIDAGVVDKLSAERLKHFNRILQEQVNELMAEMTMSFQIFELRFPLPGNPLQMSEEMPLAEGQIPRLQQEIEDLQQIQAVLQEDFAQMADFPSLKLWLKEYIADQRELEREEARERRHFERYFGEEALELLDMLRGK